MPMKMPFHILVACEDAQTRETLAERLTGEGFDTVTASDLESAWDILEARSVWLVITDRDLPGGGGLELCKRIRGSSYPHYMFTILLIHESQRQEFVAGMEAGVDDFVIEPVVFEEVLARVTSARRVVGLERDLVTRNKELENARDALNKDLEMAARIQQGLLPSSTDNLYGYIFDTLFLPCCMVGGDMFNFFPVDKDRIAFYILDVSGHGISAAMLSVAISKTLTSLPMHEAAIRRTMDEPAPEGALAPAAVVRELDLLFRSNDMVEKYFTMIYGTLDRNTGEVRFCQAGHPHPILLPATGEPQPVGEGGLPVGLIQGAEYTESTLVLSKGDRLLLYSDGITDCTNPRGNRFAEGRLMGLAAVYRDKPLYEFMRGLAEKLFYFNGSDVFSDDISLLAIERVD